jgi:hypothetical protein
MGTKYVFDIGYNAEGEVIRVDPRCMGCKRG